MAINEIHAYDAGTEFRATILQEDGAIYSLVGANIMQFIFQKPDGSSITRSASYFDTGSDGKVKYITDDTDLDQIGLWRYQVYIEKGPVEKHSDIAEFRVYANLPLE